MADYPGIYVRACGVLVEEQFASLDSFSFVKRHRYLIIIIEIYFSMNCYKEEHNMVTFGESKVREISTGISI